MGLLDRLSKWLGIKKQSVTVLCIGLDNSGKTTIINHFKPPQAKVEDIVPTIGYNVNTVSTASIKFTVLDMSGQGRYRSLWEQYYKTAEAIIFVIDSNDKLRCVVARDELENLLHHEDMIDRNVPICCLSNKKDLPDSMTAAEVSERMGLADIRNKPYCIFATNALTGEGLDSAMSWLSEEITRIKGS